ncbi:unnamed protein product [Closterium sp. Naga37s-1]|nr:unnamed protein product [Closterium sp. Naga37s-1]
MALPLRVSRHPLPCRRSASEHSPPLHPRSPRPPLHRTAALTTAPAALRTALPPATSPAAPPRAVRRPTACRSAAEAAGLASFPWENAVPGGGARGGEEEWGRGSAEAVTGDVEADVVIVGAGVVGLCIADALLMSSPDTRVAVIDSAWPCAGATGAGQGYIWMAHRSMLVPSQPSHTAPLEQHHRALQQAGLTAHLLSAAALRDVEPALQVPAGCSSALLLPSDWQLDARLAMHALLARCRQHAASGRYVELFEESVASFLRAAGGGRVVGVATAQRRVVAAQAVVVATGTWSSGFIAHALLHTAPAFATTSQASQPEDSPKEGTSGSPGSSAASSTGGGREQDPVVPHVRPRKGFLLQLTDVPPSLSLRHALMEFDYTANYAAPSAPTASPATPRPSPSPTTTATMQPPSSSPCPPAAISMTATCDHLGHLLIGAPFSPPTPPTPALLLLRSHTSLAHPPPTLHASNLSSAFRLILVPWLLPSLHPVPPPGSSRELAGFSVEPHAPTVAAILRRTALFLPSLAHLLLPCDREGAGERHMRQAVQQAEDEAIAARVNVVRTGLRPYGGSCSLLAGSFHSPSLSCASLIARSHLTIPSACLSAAPDGRPLIGPVDSLPGVLFALGHEGSGLLMAPGIADMIMAYLGRGTMPVDAHPFLPQGRLLTLQQLQHMHP